MHILVRREFVEYAVHNPTARDLLKWTRDVLRQDENFNTLNHNLQLNIPGSDAGEKKHLNQCRLFSDR